MQVLLKKARKALVKGDFKLAGNLYGRMLDREPDFVPALLEGARAFGQLGEAELAERCLDRVGGLVDGDLEIGLHMAAGFYGIGREGKALAILNGAYDRTGSADMAVALAETCERMGEVERGAEVLVGVDAARAVLLRGIFAKRGGDVGEARRCFEDLLTVEREDLDLGTKYRAGMELALCFEAEGDFAKAWETMVTARSEVMPRGQDLEILDRDFGRAMDAGLGSFDDFIFEGNSAEDGPVLVGGHLGSGVGGLAEVLVKDEEMVDLGTVNAFVRLMGTTGLDAVPPGKMKVARIAAFREAYVKQVKGFRPGIDAEKRWMEWGEGMERCGAYWLQVFPGAKVYLARRSPLDVIVENLFTFAPVHALTLQCFTAERAAAALERSLEIQERLIAVGGGAVEVVDCLEGAGRWENYREFLGEDLVKGYS